MVGILLDTEYSASLWCKSLYESLVHRLKLNRISYCQIFDICNVDLETVFVIASNREWTVNAIKQLNKGGIRPILLCNQSENLPGCIYNCVCSDINTSMKNLLDMLKSKGKTNVAIYGINTESLSDISRVDNLLAWKEPCFKSMKIFNNNGSLQKCFDEFYPHINDFDAAICANDFAAISLVRNLQKSSPKTLENFYIVSCAATELSNFYRKHILSLNMNFEQYGRAAVYIYKALIKHPYLSEMTVKVVWSLEETRKSEERIPIELRLGESKSRFYTDTELNEMLIADKLLTLTDSLEKTIIKGLVNGLSYEQIADDCFLTVGGIKYRLKKLIEKIGAENKNQVIYLIKKYLPTDSLF